jgi:hypothetical protein
VGTIILFGVLSALLALALALNVFQAFAYIAMRGQSETREADRKRAVDFAEQLRKDLETAQRPVLIRLSDEQVNGLAAMLLAAFEKQQAEKDALENSTIH